MRLPRFGIIAVVSFLLVVILNGDFGFLAQLPGARWGINGQFLPQSQVLAQTPDERKVEADRLFQHGNDQIINNQAESALPVFQQALIIYQEIGDRQMEGRTLGLIGTAYLLLEDFQQAINYYQESLLLDLKESQLYRRCHAKLKPIAYSSKGIRSIIAINCRLL